MVMPRRPQIPPAHAPIDLIHRMLDPLGLPLRQPEPPVPGAHEARAPLLGVCVQARCHRRVGRQPLRRDQLLGQRALGNLFKMQRLAGGLEDGVGGVEVGHEVPSFSKRQSSAASGSGPAAWALYLSRRQRAGLSVMYWRMALKARSVRMTCS